MATTTTNFGWDIPQSTDLVKDGATAIAALGQDIDTAFVDLKGGTTGQVLAKASNTDLDYSWVAQDDSNAIQNAIVDAKGDLIAATANDTPARLAVGTNGYVLTADSAEATGLKWAAASGGQALNLISTTSLSSVSSQSVNNVFSSTYTNYVVILSTTATSAAGASLTMKLRASGTDSSSTYGAFLMGINSGGGAANNTSSSTSWYLTESHSSTTAGYNYAIVNLINPNLANATLFNVNSLGLTTAVGQYLSTTGSGIHDTATAYDGFTIIRSSGTFSGAISVYGYSK